MAAVKIHFTLFLIRVREAALALLSVRELVAAGQCGRLQLSGLRQKVKAGCDCNQPVEETIVRASLFSALDDELLMLG
jgi:hypothetical protein